MTTARVLARLREDGGQTVVLVTLLLTMLLAITALAVDGGRFYAERRFLQNAADAAALACAQNLKAGGATSDAESVGRSVANLNLAANPLGVAVTVATTPVYNSGGSADKRNLVDGVVASASDCRAALRTTIDMYFIRMAAPGLARADVWANAHTKSKGGQLPIVVNRFDNPPGPGGTFHDYTKQEASDGNCNDQGVPSGVGVTCPDATLAVPGRERVIVGNSYTASDSDFRGFIALDLRDFTTTDASNNPLHQYYNNTSGMNENTLKAQESTYIPDGYPGPDLVAYDPAASPPQIALQLATMSGNSTGIVVDTIKQYYKVGDLILVQLFNGQVQEIPDFSLNAPTSINKNAGDTAGDGPTFRVGSNTNFRQANDVVDLVLQRDDFNSGSTDTPAEIHVSEDVTFDPDNFTPAGGAGTQVTLKNVQVEALLATGIYSVVLRGDAYRPPHPGGGTALGSHKVYVPFNVGGVTRDFTMAFTATSVTVDPGVSGTFTFSLGTGSGSASFGNNSVSFAIDRGSCGAGTIELVGPGSPVCVGSSTISPASAVPDRSNPPTVTITVPSTGLATATYTFVLRGRGNNTSGQPVVHVQALQLGVGSTAGGARKYVEVQGYAVFKIVDCTLSGTNATNSVCGKAVTGKYNDPTDPALTQARKFGLAPWGDAPY